MNRLYRDVAAGAAALAVMLVLHLVPLGASTELSRRLLSALHAPAFATLALLLRALAAGHLRGTHGRTSRWSFRPLALDGLALAGAVVAGTAFELAQVAGPRRAELFDLGADLCGAMGGLGLYAAVRAHREGRTRLARPAARLALVLASAGLILAPAVPVATRLAALRERDAALPVLGAFEEPWELGFWAARRGALGLVPVLPGWPAARGQRVGCVRLWTRRWPGLALREPPPDWRPYSRLSLEAFLPGDRPVSLLIRIEDAEHDDRYDDRFNAALELPPGPSRHVIDLEAVRTAPATREMNLSRISALALFIERPVEPLTLCFDDVRLVP